MSRSKSRICLFETLCCKLYLAVECLKACNPFEFCLQDINTLPVPFEFLQQLLSCSVQLCYLICAQQLQSLPFSLNELQLFLDLLRACVYACRNTAVDVGSCQPLEHLCLFVLVGLQECREFSLCKQHGACELLIFEPNQARQFVFRFIGTQFAVLIGCKVGKVVRCCCKVACGAAVCP